MKPWPEELSASKEAMLDASDVIPDIDRILLITASLGFVKYYAVKDDK